MRSKVHSKSKSHLSFLCSVENKKTNRSDQISRDCLLGCSRIIKSVVTGQPPVTLELRNTPGDKRKQAKGGTTHISQLTQFMPPPETYNKNEIGRQPTMCQVHTGAYISLLAPGQTDYSAACHQRKTTTYVIHVLPITTHTHDRRKSIGEEKQRKEKKIKERKEKTRKRKNEKRNGKTRQENTRGSKEKNDITVLFNHLTLVTSLVGSHRNISYGLGLRLVPSTVKNTKMKDTLKSFLVAPAQQADERRQL